MTFKKAGKRFFPKDTDMKIQFVDRKRRMPVSDTPVVQWIKKWKKVSVFS